MLRAHYQITFSLFIDTLSSACFAQRQMLAALGMETPKTWAYIMKLSWLISADTYLEGLRKITKKMYISQPISGMGNLKPSLPYYEVGILRV